MLPNPTIPILLALSIAYNDFIIGNIILRTSKLSKGKIQKIWNWKYKIRMRNGTFNH